MQHFLKLADQQIQIAVIGFNKCSHISKFNFSKKFMTSDGEMTKTKVICIKKI
jgi:hypothetical protein